MTDIVERLRGDSSRMTPPIMHEAADEIERLLADRPDWAEYQRLINENREQQAEIERLRDEVRSAHFDGYMAGVGDSEDYDHDPTRMELEAWEDREDSNDNDLP